EGMLDTDLEEMFMDRLSQCALHRAYDTMDGVMEFAREKQVPFLNALEERSAFLKSNTGWLLNRLRIAFVSALRKVRGRVRLLAYLISRAA
ncbi:MAG: hypothetical protein HY912_18450, partial [Desulfomonile tiedjei]|nr:hypothetical protein [Desulfomonile tiedjei]